MALLMQNITFIGNNSGETRYKWENTLFVSNVYINEASYYNIIGESMENTVILRSIEIPMIKSMKWL